MSIELYTANRGCITQHEEDTKYLQRQDGMYVMLKDLLCDYEAALVENSLRDSVYFYLANRFSIAGFENSLGVYNGLAGYWTSPSYALTVKLTRAQALYIATGDTNVLRIND
jgi:hypothetical protein